MMRKLPRQVQGLAQEAFSLYAENPQHPSLRHHRLKDTKKGSHKEGSSSISITHRYRAIYYQDGRTRVWYWIGSHNDFDTFVGGK
ncbi:MAG: hypothetical protein U0793_13815 [Gemmataceae bacterium]